ncbi:hypothetical protein [Bradyrhizobium oligotrophicum]|uniref:hypothetical protein n=1 Tax=Bradyrhizobium oligotrophicum TaxID=44255 RepID=UPI003EBF22E7
MTAFRTPHPPITDNFAYKFETPANAAGAAMAPAAPSASLSIVRRWITVASLSASLQEG